MAGRRHRTTILGFLGAIVVFAVLFSAVGVDELVSQLAGADPNYVALVVGVTLGWLLAWSLALRTVLGVLGVPLSPLRSFFVFAGAMFSNNVTPFGQAGGEPVTALLISRVVDEEYETGLAAIASVDTLNFVPSISLALVGAGYFATETTLGRRLEFALGAVIVLGVAVPAAIYAGWNRRRGLEERIVRVATPVVRRIAGVVPRVTPPTAADVENRIRSFFVAIERIATDREAMATALALSTLGWVCQMVGLWLAFRAVGSSIPLSLALFLVPMAAIAGVAPLPGGVGGIESALIVLLIAATGAINLGVSAGVIAAAVVIYRGAVYWVPVLIGGVVTSVLTVRTRA